MVAIVVTEKPSTARNMVSALGGTKGSHKGTAYEVASLRGHLYEQQAAAAGLGVGTIHRLRNGGPAGPGSVAVLCSTYGARFEELFKLGNDAAREIRPEMPKAAAT